MKITVKRCGVGYLWSVAGPDGRTLSTKGFIPSGWEPTPSKAKKAARKAYNHLLQLRKGETA
ncbi:hypothetical protein SEA_MOLIVIA_93 [Arthrobacter phage Molivia]|uniref:Uncharacterized protein n=1 Tax=Arthrobacter phage Molivia TaxID=2015839 RepID=A0A286S2F0_9CAUD|nr:hypothetical protein FDI28_gp23 [Arthrobacter phage Molivia]ASX99314.1 hypothetical protein SEA_MOLIVIA_93 [Arthrobacter phage Molivia]